MKFKELAEYFSKIEQVSSRLAMTELLSDLFKKLDKDEFDKVIYLLQGQLTPTYISVDFGLGEKMVIKAVIKALQIEPSLFKREYQKVGDIGTAVEHFKKEIISIGEQDWSVVEVFAKLEKLAFAGGGGSQEVKLAILSELIQTLDGLSARYIVRIPTNTLRLGFSDMTILDALSWMAVGDKSLRPEVEKAYQVRPDLGFVGKTFKFEGLEAIQKVLPDPFTPILMMRAQRLGTIDEIVDKIGKASIEPKYDGFRIQVHVKTIGGEKQVKLYSRNLEEVSYMYPDVIEGVKRELKAKEVILEGEAIGFDPYTGNFLPFQETVQRKRKYNITEKALEIPLKMFVFELLYLDGVSHLNTPFMDRKQILAKHIKVTGDIFKDTLILSPDIITEDAKEIEKHFDDAVSRGLEGIMIKKIDGIYQPGARGWNWIKYKRTHSAKVEDTIDCLVMGFDVGKGKRSDFGIGAFLVGVYDEKEDMFKTVAKIGTGLTDEEWRELKRRCDKLASKNMPALYDVDKMMDVDYWVKPEIVVEIQADEITRSSVHTAGREMEATKTGKGMQVKTSGYALRFPRLVRFRDDKKPEDATALQELKEIVR